MLTTLGLASLAGVLSILSPCVLPLVPIVVGAASAQGRLGPAALAAGLTLSFTALGIFLATAGFALGLDADIFRTTSAVLLVAFGTVLLVPALQLRFAAATAPVGAWIDMQFGSRTYGTGASGQFGVGLLLGAVWSPCVGPTLGAASVMASRGENLGSVTLTMLAFGLGAGLPLLIIGTVSQGAFLKRRAQIAKAGNWLKAVMGASLILVGVLILSGQDKRLEAYLVDISPAWLTELTTAF